MRRYRVNLVVWLLLSICLAGPLRAQNPTGWQQLSGDRFTVYYQPRDAQNAERIKDIVMTELPSIRHDLGVSQHRNIQLYLAPNASAFQRLAGGNIPHWGEAVARPASALIVLKSPRWHHPETPLSIVLNHELVHVLAGILSGDVRLPAWFHEGLAILISGERAYAGGSEISRALLTGRLMRLDEINAVLGFSATRARLAYQHAFASVQYLTETYGYQSLSELLRTTAEVRDFRRAFHATYGMHLARFEDELHRDLQQRYRFTFLLEFESLLWTLIPLLFVAAWISVKWRNRRKMQRWHEEEQQHETMYFEDTELE